ncbi:adenosylcobinamide-GDP ribazoletransferase [Amylibacter sp.]|nr:adenosylcobinamide-GDP ribazoletransferase [Amylibacter sp.]
MNDNQKDTLIESHDIWAAVSLLTRLKVPVDHSRAGTRANNATWAYPIVGALIGAVSGIIFIGLNLMGLTTGFSAAVTLLVLIAITGGMHEDGLADCADGFWGGQNSIRRLEIMKDSSIGVYGACALILFLIAEWSLFELLVSKNPIFTLAGIGAISRLPMVIAMRIVPNSRNNGLSATVGKPQLISVYIAIITTFIIALICFGISGLLITLVGLLFALPVFLVAKAKIGGQTGDVLGASQKFAEIAALSTALIL